MSYKVLLPHDGSEAVEAALSWAVRLVGEAGGSVELLRVLELPPVTVAPIPVPMPFPTDEDVAQARAELAAAAQKTGLACTQTVLVAAHAGEAILEHAEKTQATLLVMGTHARGGIARLVLGSVAEHVARRARCPLVTVRGAYAPHAARGESLES